MELDDLLSDELLNWVQGDDAGTEIDRLLLEASETYDKLESYGPHSTATSSALKKQRRAFATPKTDEEIERAKAKGVPKKTLEDTKYCTNLWSEWQRHRQETLGDSIPNLTELNRRELQYWLTRFVLEVRKRDGSEFDGHCGHKLLGKRPATRIL